MANKKPHFLLANNKKKIEIVFKCCNKEEIEEILVYNKKGFELKAVSRTTKPIRCKVHWVQSEPCLSNPSAPRRNLPVRTIAQSVRRPGIEPGNTIVT
jgi:hypothetical protein